MAIVEAPSRSKRLISWAGTHLLALLTVAGFVVYGVLRLSYATFYGRFDVEPEEVGLGQAEILAQTGIALVVYVSFIGGTVGLAFLGYRALGIRPPRVERDAPLWRRTWAFIGGPGGMVLLPTLLGVASFVLYDLPTRARSLADQVERGEAVQTSISFRVHRPLAIVDLHVRAVPVALTTLTEDQLPEELTSPSLRYLGHAGGVLVLYDWKTERVLRVPRDSVVVSTSR